MNYKPTINLPQTRFPMKANLPEREPEILKFWEENDIYKKVLNSKDKNKKFIIHDGPPYSNAHIHLGLALNKIIKDITIKYKALKGFFTPFIPGSDNHGMPIENVVIKEIGRDKSPEVIRKRCRDFAQKWVDVQKREFKRLGLFALWEEYFQTMNPEYEGKELEIFADIVEKGYVYREFMPVHWCPKCETALALSEIEYKDVESPSLTFRMNGEGYYALVWTTTPWTIISNVALAVNPDFTYAIVSVNGEKYLLAKDLVDYSKEKFGWENMKFEAEIKGDKLIGKKFKHPFFDRESPVILASYVSKETGTGIVHIAPGHGKEDYESGRKYNLPILSPVNEKGKFTEEAGVFAGLTTDEASKKVIEIMRKNGSFVHLENIIHSYPHCWRCKSPLIFRATEQWFLSVDHNNLREQSLAKIEGVRWHPEEGKNKIYTSVKERPDWCLSRQRIWGVNIPAFYCANCGEPLLDPDVIRHIAEIFKRESSDAWHKHSVEELLPKGIKCKKCGTSEFKKEMDVLDVWFDSGSSSFIILSEDDWPSDMYIEGPDQHRGWYNSSLMIAMIERGYPPYKTVITHGWVLDEDGKSMHKSLGNAIEPSEIIEKGGAEILRIWVASSDYTQDVKLGPEIIERAVDGYRKIRNTFRFMLGNVFDFSPDQAIPENELFPQDRYIILKWRKLLKEVEQDYENFLFHRVYRKLYSFIVMDLSSFYLDILKDRLYTWGKNSHGRKAAQTVLYKILKELLIVFSPIMSYTSEEAYQNLSHREKESVFLEDFPDIEEISAEEEEFLKEFEDIVNMREELQHPMEDARRDKFIGNSLEARVLVKGDSVLLKKYSKFLPEIFIVSQVDLTNEINTKYSYKGEKFQYGIVHSSGKKCERCWIWSESVGRDKEYPTLCSKCVTVIKEGNFGPKNT